MMGPTIKQKVMLVCQGANRGRLADRARRIDGNSVTRARTCGCVVVDSASRMASNSSISLSTVSQEVTTSRPHFSRTLSVSVYVNLDTRQNPLSPNIE